ncbi:MAG: class I SAM-dependent methyltransferase [Methylophilaceae bacterium]|jgi:SAM-dependent methyltransferase|nr:class I SAM-dependent methyltransferase [Methylophilaceae bacterium]
MPSSHEPPSSWLIRHAPLIPAGGIVLDLACGSGRNARWLAEQGWRVEAVDRDESAIAELQQIPGLHAFQADLENGPWPFAGRLFDGIVVCRYLHRPLLPLLTQCLAPNGVLIYETFMRGQEKFGRPQNPDFLLKPDELLDVFAGPLSVNAFEQGIVEMPRPMVIQRICALMGAPGRLMT